MIESLRIENIAIVERADLEFDPGLNVLTGETGAGKSIVLGALALLVGARAAPDSLRQGAEQGAVEALFRTDALAELEHELVARDLMCAPEQHGIPAPDAHQLVLRRTLSRGGRGRARVGGQLVPIGSLEELFSGRIEISSQHSSQALLRADAHGRLLDAAGGLLAERAAVRSCYDAARRVDAELAELCEQAAERARRRDFLAFQLAEFEEVGLASGELDALSSEHARLAHAERLCAEGGAAVAALQGEAEGGPASSASDRLAVALRGLETMSRWDDSLVELISRLRDVDAELREVSGDLERYVDSIEGEPARLEQLEERIAQVERLRRKYGRSEEEILAFRDRIAAELDAVVEADSRIDALAAERQRHLEMLAGAARDLTAGRAKAAGKLSREVQRSLRDLGMPDARFAIALEPAANLASLPEGMASGPSGAEAPEFRFSANRGEPLRSLQKVASGGELSRVFLGVKRALRRADAAMVLVFDEVDAGVGGRAAERVGRALAELASRHQVLCITHLPQIAAFADAHFRVEKSAGGGRTLARVERIDGDARVEEIARMAGGEQISEATRRHARHLMSVKDLTQSA